MSKGTCAAEEDTGEENSPLEAGVELNTVRKKALLTAAKNVIGFAIEKELPSENLNQLGSLKTEIERLLTCPITELDEEITKTSSRWIQDIRCGRNIFSDRYLNILMSYEYTEQMWTDAECKKATLAEIAATVKEDYKSYNLAALQQEHDKARAKVSEVIQNHTLIKEEETEDSLKEYAAELYDAGESLNDAGKAAVENYIAEYIRQYILANKDSILKGADAESLQEKITEDTQAINAEQSKLAELRSWQRVCSFQDILTVISSSVYTAKKETDASLEEAFASYAAVLLYEEMVCHGIISYEKGITQEGIADYLKKYPSIPEGFYASVREKILTFYNNAYSDYSEAQKELYKYLTNAEAASSDAAKAYADAKALTADLKSIQKDWEAHKEKRYAESLIDENYTDFNQLLALLPPEEQEAFNEILKAQVSSSVTFESVKAKAILAYRAKLEKAGADGAYSQEDFVNAFNAVLETYKNDKGVPIFTGITKGTAFYTPNEVNTYASEKMAAVMDAAVQKSRFDFYDYSQLNTEWYNAYLAGSDFLYVYLSMRDDDVDLIQNVLEYESSHKIGRAHV